MKLAWDHLTLRIASGRGGRVRCEPGWRLAPSWSSRLEDLDVWFVWAGRGVMRLHGGRSLELRPGVCLWMRPGGTYLAEQNAADRLGVTFIHFDLHDRRTGGQRPEALPPEVHELSNVAYADAVLRRIVELTWMGRASPMTRSDEVESVTVAEQLLRGFLMDLEISGRRSARFGQPGTPRHHYELVMRAASPIREDPGRTPSITDLARQAGYSPDHFTRVFKQVLGQSPQEFIVNEKINRARQLLLESSLTVSQIADALGYQSVYFFSAQFKRKTGSSPTEYRRG